MNSFRAHSLQLLSLINLAGIERITKRSGAERERERQREKAVINLRNKAELVKCATIFKFIQQFNMKHGNKVGKSLPDNQISKVPYLKRHIKNF